MMPETPPQTSLSKKPYAHKSAIMVMSRSCKCNPNASRPYKTRNTMKQMKRSDHDDAESSPAVLALPLLDRRALTAASTSDSASFCHFSLVSWSANAAAPEVPTLSYKSLLTSRLIFVYSSFVTSFFKYLGFNATVTMR